MKTERIRLDRLLTDSILRDDICRQIKAGAIFVYPTETIYGVGGIATEEVAAKIISAKGRAPENPMILLSSRRSVIDKTGISFSATAEKLARLWPGNITLVLPNNSGGTTGVRVSDHPAVIALTKSLDLPIYSTSANRSGSPYLNNPDEIFGCFDGKADFMIDAGNLPFSLPSSVVSIDRADAVKILREGAISEDVINAAISNC